VPTITPLEGTRLSLLARRPAAIGWWGGEVRAVAGVDAWRIDGPEARWLARPMADLSWERAAGTRDRAVLRTIAGAVIGPVPPAQFGIRVGGAVTLPGVPFHAQRGTWGVSQRIEWQRRVPAPSLPLGRFGRTNANVVLAPFVVGAVTGTGDTADGQASVGLGLLTLFDVLRLDVAVPIGWRGRTPVMFSIDVSRDFWRIL
jgi:hypothetical protein